MAKRVASLFGGLGLLLLASAAQASPIPMSSCVSNSGNFSCDIYETASHVTVMPSTFGLGDPGWLIGYTFLLEPGTTYSGTSDNANISDVVFIRSNEIDLYSDDDPAFMSMIATVLSATDQAQIVGLPQFAGALHFNNIGLVPEDASGVALLQEIRYFLDPADPTCVAAGFSCSGGNDSVTIHSGVPAIVLPPPTNGEVPEPTTIALLSTGLIGAAIRRRRSRVQA